MRQNSENQKDPSVQKFIYDEGNDPFKIPIPAEFEKLEADVNYQEPREGFA